MSVPDTENQFQCIPLIKIKEILFIKFKIKAFNATTQLSHMDLLPVNKKIDYPHIQSSVYMWIVDLFIDREQVPVAQPFTYMDQHFNQKGKKHLHDSIIT